MKFTTLIRLGLLAVMISALAGCGGGSDGAPGAAGSNGSNGSNGINGSGNLVSVAAMTATDWQALKPTASNIHVNMASGTPVVTFKVTDQNGNAVTGLGGSSQSTANAAIPGSPRANYNIQFTLAKLVPTPPVGGISIGPGKWVSYLMTAPASSSSSSKTNLVTIGGKAMIGAFPQADSQGTLVDNGDGTYQYTFYRDITKAADYVTAFTDSADGLTKVADMGDLTYDASLTHRLGIIITGNMPGTGTNTPDAVQATLGVPLVYTFNAGYDFVPAGGTPMVTRDIVTKDSCSDCHAGKGIGHASTNIGGWQVGRNDPRLCVTCHTDQIRFTFDNLAVNNGEAPMNADGVTFTVQTGTNAVVRPAQAILYGRAVGNYPSLIHKMHMGEGLVKQGYNFNNDAAGLFNEKKFPQSPANCTKCHDGSAKKSDGSVNAKKTADGDNWKNVPSRLACGACHDGIDFANGTGITLANKAADLAAGSPIGTTHTGHQGLAQLNDAGCNNGSCHTAATIAVVHELTVPTLNNPVVKTGVSKITYDLASVTVNSLGQPVVKFRINRDGVAVKTLNTTAASPVPATFAAITDATKGDLTRGPSIYVGFAVAQDGIAAPADFNGRVGGALNSLLTSGAANAGTFTDATGAVTVTGDTAATVSATGAVSAAGTITTTDTANGYFTVTLTGTTAAPISIPSTAKMKTGLIVGRFEQVVGGVTVKIKPILKTLVATGDTGRRVIVAAAKCNSCHEQLGTKPEFHNGERNDPTACAICHNPNEINDGAQTKNYGWPGASNTFIHGIHAGSKRSKLFTWAAWDFNTLATAVGTVEYPGVLKNCEQCHLPDTVNFGANGASVAPNMLPTTASAGNSTAVATAGPGGTDNSWAISPYIDPTVDYGLPATVSSTGVVTPAASTTLVNSPMASACYSCHDTSLAKSHMTSNGGAIYEARGTAIGKTEQCLVCHGKGRVADVAVIHQ